MAAAVDNFNMQSVSERKNQCWGLLNISSIESAQLHIRQHLYRQIENIYGKITHWKLQSLIQCRDAQLHRNAFSLPSLTVRRRNVVFPVHYPSHSSQYSTPPLIWIESLLWNLINTMELDAPCRGLKLKSFRMMISDVADMFRKQALEQFKEIRNKSLSNIFAHQCSLLIKATREFKNIEAKRVEIINRCSNLLVLFHSLHFEQLKAESGERSERDAPQQSEQLSREVPRSPTQVGNDKVEKIDVNPPSIEKAVHSEVHNDIRVHNIIGSSSDSSLKKEEPETVEVTVVSADSNDGDSTEQTSPSVLGSSTWAGIQSAGLEGEPATIEVDKLSINNSTTSHPADYSETAMATQQQYDNLCSWWKQLQYLRVKFGLSSPTHQEYLMKFSDAVTEFMPKFIAMGRLDLTKQYAAMHADSRFWLAELGIS